MRTQVAGVQGVTVAGQAVAAMVVEQGRDEMQLDVAALVRGERRAHEAAALRDVRRPWPVAPQQVLESNGHVIESVVTYRFRALLQGADVQMVLQVCADAG